MDLIKLGVDFILHLDKHLSAVISYCGAWSYAVFFAIIFSETGLVVTPFLPGDSLLFALGSLAALGALQVHGLFLLLALAAVLGNLSNYGIGYVVGPKVFHTDSRWLNREHLVRTHAFFERHGGKTVIISRFLPIFRTFAPFVAGIGSMQFWRFFLYNLIGGTAWVATFVYGGYFFGNLPVVKRNFSVVIFAIIFISLLPAVIGFLREKYGRRTA